MTATMMTLPMDTLDDDDQLWRAVLARDARADGQFCYAVSSTGIYTSSVPSRSAPDLSGLITTSLQIVAVVGIATFGTAYLNLAPHPGPGPAMHAFALVTAGFAATTFLAAGAAYRSTHPKR